jgi:hypothetical protein
MARHHFVGTLVAKGNTLAGYWLLGIEPHRATFAA